MILYASELSWNNCSYVITVNDVSHLLVCFIFTLKMIHSHHKFPVFDLISHLRKCLSCPVVSVGCLFSVVVIVFYSVLVFPQIISLRADAIRSPMTGRKKVVKDARVSYIFWQKSKRDHLIGTVPANIHKIASQFIIYCQRICKGLISALFL